MRLGNMRIWTG